MASKGPYQSTVKLPPLANLFSIQEEREEAELEKIVPIKLTELHPFPNHPFQVRDDDEMQKMVDSVKEYGVVTPIIVRPCKVGGYEIVSGHRRNHAAQLAGLATIPAIVRDMDDDASVIYMVDANCQRENVLPSEKARAYQMKLEAIKRKAGRPLKNNVCQVGTDFSPMRSDVALAENTSESARNVQRFIRLNELIPELQALVDDKKLKFNPAVEISYLSSEQQQQFFEFIDAQDCTPSLSQAQQLKAASKEQTFSPDRLEEIMTSHPPSVKPQEQRITITVTQIAKYFPQHFTTEQMAAQIIKLLEAQYRHRQHGMER